jgi:hypothetical protein
VPPYATGSEAIAASTALCGLEVLHGRAEISVAALHIGVEPLNHVRSKSDRASHLER